MGWERVAHAQIPSFGKNLTGPSELFIREAGKIKSKLQSVDKGSGRTSLVLREFVAISRIFSKNPNLPGPDFS